MLCGQAIAAYVVAATAAPCAVHYRTHGELSALQAFLTLFCAVNALICFFELALCYRCDLVARDAAKLRERFPATTAGRFAALKELFCKPVLGDALSFWSQIWSYYSLYDPSYADTNSWGFWIDVGNGHVTLIPSIIWLIGSTFPLLPARLFGLIGLLTFYQELYGTIVYFAAFVKNRRYLGQSKLELALSVGLTNGLWILGPFVGLCAAVACIYRDDYSAFYSVK